MLIAVEGDAFPNGILGIEQQQPFPFPGSFTWSRDGDPLVNISANVSFGYPELSLNPVSRTDSGLYTLTASNYLLDNDSVLIGSGTGSFTLDVLCKFLGLSVVQLAGLPLPSRLSLSLSPSLPPSLPLCCRVIRGHNVYTYQCTKAG